MDCWQCIKAARGSCRFCGRGVCADHAREQPYVLGMWRAEDGTTMRVLVVEDALHCGICTARPDPVDLDGLG